MHIKLEENEKYKFVEANGTHVINWIEKYVCHYEATLSGKPFLLMPWQKQIVLDMYGWVRRDNGLRKHKYLWLEIGKNAGKSPFITALALFNFLGSGEEGQQIFSVGGDYKQADITFGSAKKILGKSPKLLPLIDAGKIKVKQYAIEVPKTNSVWGVLSGDTNSKSGFRPSTVCADEIMEWKNRSFWDIMAANADKRANSMFLCATNAGKPNTIAHELHQDALKVLEDPTSDPTFYPVIFTAPLNCPVDDIEAIRTASPSINITMPEETLVTLAQKSKRSAAKEAFFRRVYLTQWVQSADKWLNIPEFMSCQQPLQLSEMAEFPLVIGYDGSLVDDLTALIAVFVGPTHLYCFPYFWLPRKTAWNYEDKDGIEYSEWEKNNHILLLDSPTISLPIQEEIAAFVTDLSTRFNLQGFCYDRWKANHIVSVLEKQAIKCIPISQDFSLSKSCNELERRLTERTMLFNTNDVMTFCAENVEVISDKLGNIRPVKEGRTAQDVGKRSLKIDGITALLNAMTFIDKVALDSAKKTDPYSGEILIYV